MKRRPGGGALRRARLPENDPVTGLKARNHLRSLAVGGAGSHPAWDRLLSLEDPELLAAGISHESSASGWTGGGSARVLTGRAARPLRADRRGAIQPDAESRIGEAGSITPPRLREPRTPLP